MTQYRKGGLGALARRARGDRGVPRILSPALKFAIQGLALEKPHSDKLHPPSDPPVALPSEPFDSDVLAASICMTSGNFRLLNRLLTQIERVLKLNDASATTMDIVDAARESLVIGQT